MPAAPCPRRRPGAGRRRRRGGRHRQDHPAASVGGPADQPGRAGDRCRGGRRQLAAQDRGEQGGRLRRGVGAQLLGEAFPGPGVGGQRRRDPAAAHVGAQQHPQRLLVVGIVVQGLRRGLCRGDPVARLEQGGGRHLAGPAGQPLQAGQAQLRPLARGSCRAGAADQGQRDPGGRGRAHRVARAAPPVRLVGELGQLGRVEPVTAQQVTTVVVFDPVPAEDRAQPAHQDGQLVVGPGWWAGVPQSVDQHGRGHRLAVGERQQPQREPGLPAA